MSNPPRHSAQNRYGRSFTLTAGIGGLSEENQWRRRFAARITSHGESDLIGQAMRLIDQGLRTSANKFMPNGDPLLGPPEYVRKDLAGMADNLLREYTWHEGELDVRESLDYYIKHELGIPDINTVEQVLPGHGVAELFSKSLGILIDPGDVVISASPTFGLHTAAVSNYEGEMRTIPVHAANDYRIPPEELDAFIRKTNAELLSNHDGTGSPPRVKMFMNTNPHNPSGAAIIDTPENRAYYQAIHEVLFKHDVVFVDDLAYRGTEYDAFPKDGPPRPEHMALPFLRAVPEARGQCITLVSPSKSLGMPGVRTGFMIADQDFINEAATLTLNLNSGISRISQIALASAYGEEHKDERQEYLSKNAEEFRLRRDMVRLIVEGEQHVTENENHPMGAERIAEIKQVMMEVLYAGQLLSSSRPSLLNADQQKLIMYAGGFRDGLALANSSPENQLSPIVHHADCGFCTIPPHEKTKLQRLVNKLAEGIPGIQGFNTPQATFYYMLDATGLRGKFPPVNIDAELSYRSRDVERRETLLTIQNMEESPTPEAIRSSADLNVLCSWVSDGYFLPGERCNARPEDMLLRMSFAEAPLLFINALTALKHATSLIKDSPEEAVAAAREALQEQGTRIQGHGK